MPSSLFKHDDSLEEKGSNGMLKKEMNVGVSFGNQLFKAAVVKRDRKSLSRTSAVIGRLQCCCVFVSCVACAVGVASFANCSKPVTRVNVS